MNIEYIKTDTILETEKISLNYIRLHREDFRKKIIKDKSYWESLWYKSPSKIANSIEEQNKILGDNFVYERNLRYPNIENYYGETFAVPDGLTYKALLYNSGIGAIVNSIRTYMDGYSRKKIQILCSRGYFETFYYISGLPYVYVTELENYDVLIDYDVLIVEPVLYSEKMQSIDYFQIMDKFVSNDTVKKIKMIIIDCTLTTHLHLDIDRLYDFMRVNKEVILVITESLLKLHQLGLEISSAGLTQIIFSEAGKFTQSMKNFLDKCEKNRELYSINLSLNNLRGISHPFMYSNEVLSIYSSAIFNNNGWVAQRLNSEKFEVFHPILDDWNYLWSVSPMIIIKLKPDRKARYIEALKFIENRVSEMKIEFYNGASFGFFESRYEIINYSIERDEWFLKLAIGFNNKDLEKIIDIINNL
ncbi:hypothetical protein HZY91_02490 [Facklamia sp. DSM 111018]|uniref:Uncharacterized protein n=1 Tax=Facklamia lactis TaxID=2749967 RepID=A0ABS0LNL3_9LACT|nr:hypothetical protein [Facklamia lactis]MBG9985758.1 hypothetical protein [Facklamia lactis]